jgi:hypothetical protein
MLLSSPIHSTSTVDLWKSLPRGIMYQNKPCISCQIATLSSRLGSLITPPKVLLEDKSKYRG